MHATKLRVGVVRTGLRMVTPTYHSVHNFWTSTHQKRKKYLKTEWVEGQQITVQSSGKEWPGIGQANIIQVVTDWHAIHVQEERWTWTLNCNLISAPAFFVLLQRHQTNLLQFKPTHRAHAQGWPVSVCQSRFVWNESGGKLKFHSREIEKLYSFEKWNNFE